MTAASTLALPQQEQRGSNWEAELNLHFARRNHRTILKQRSHRGPLVIQKVLYPEQESVCHVILIHPPGGLAGGDTLRLNIDSAEGAHTLTTTPGAGKWYKANGAAASQRLTITAAADSVVEWFPQESIIYDNARADWHGRVDLAESARFAGWEIVCLGRLARGERFRHGELKQRLEIYRGGRILWGEHIHLRGGDALLTSIAGLRGYPVYATFVIAAAGLPPDLLERCRALAVPEDGICGVTAPPGLFVGRYLGSSTESARRYFEALWHHLRPWYAGIAAERPRIWNT